MDDDTQPMEAIRTADPWSVHTWDFRDPNVGFGYVTVEAAHPEAPPDKPWMAYLAFIERRRAVPFYGWFATADQAKAAINAAADQRHAQNAEVSA